MEESHIAGTDKVCKCPHHKMVPWIIILIGIDFLLGAVNVLTGTFVAVTWPILVIIAGVVKLNRCACCTK